MKKTIYFLLVLLLTALMITGCGETQVSNEGGEGLSPNDMTVASGKSGGTWYPVGGAIANSIQDGLEDKTISVMQGTGNANIMGVQSGQYTMGISFSFANDDAVAGRDPFGTPHDNIAGMATLYTSPIQFVVRADSDIMTIDDLKGKRIAPGLVGTSGEVLVKNILSIYDITYEDMDKVEHLAYADAAMLMKDGHIDCFVPFTTIPAPVIQDIAVSSGGVRILSISQDKLVELKSINAGYNEFVIPAGTYNGQEEDVVTVGSNNTLIVGKNINEELVYQMTKSLCENEKNLQEVHKVLNDWSPEKAAQNIGVELHPGALRYYQEIGAIK